MADNPGGYLRPTGAPISDSWQGHKNRKPPSQEPGTDYACAYGTSLKAPEDGVIVDVKDTNSAATGRYITLDLHDGRRIRMLHLSRRTVNRGDRVVRGQEIAKSGASAWGRDWGIGAHVHVTLWATQKYVFGPNGTMDFETQIGADNDGTGLTYSQTVADRQNFLNAARGEKLVVDGFNGANTANAIRRYQTFLKSRGWYADAVDGVWGGNTQKGHEKYYAEWSKPKAPVAPAVVRRAANVTDLGNLRFTKGLQKVARLYGYKGLLDDKWGAGSQAGFQAFLNQNYGGSLAGWLRAKYGYRDRDDIWGPNMAAAAARAENANWRQL